jgi:hypothetical protein
VADFWNLERKVPAADGSLVARVVAAAGLFELNQIKLLGCQTAAQSNFDLQRFSGVVSNRAPSLTLQQPRARQSRW